jgi:hypothetical protein
MKTDEQWIEICRDPQTRADFLVMSDFIHAVQADALEFAYEEITDAPTVLDAMNRIRALKPSKLRR